MLIGDDNSSRRTIPVVTFVLIALNALLFFAELSGGDAFIHQWAFVPSRFLADPGADLPTLFTSMFMHAGWVHLGGNMLYLWIFGDNVEDRLGHIRFTVFYLFCGLAATFAQLAFSAGSHIPNLGASGAISGVLGAYILMFPQGRVKMWDWRHVSRGPARIVMGIRVKLWRWGHVTTIPARIVLGIWIGLQLFSGILSAATIAKTGGVAYMAHIGGFLAGFLLAFFLR